MAFAVTVLGVGGMAAPRRRGDRQKRMRIDLTALIERGEGAFLVFPMKTRVTYAWYAAGRAHLRRREEGYLVPVADSIVREQLKHVHVGCEATPGRGGLREEDADQLDSVLRLAGVPFMVDRARLRDSTENAVWVRFPDEDEIPIQFSRFFKWQGFWGREALLIWWQCESEAEYQQRLEAEWRERGIVPTVPQLPTVDLDDGADEDMNHA